MLENVPGLLALGFRDVLGDLAALGYDAEWDCIPAAAFGAPHLRYRVWVVAFSGAGRCIQGSPKSNETLLRTGAATSTATNLQPDVPNARSGRRRTGERDVLPGEPDAVRGGADVADASGPNGFVKSTERRQAAQGGRQAETFRSRSGTADVADADGKRLQRRDGEILRECSGKQLVGAGGTPLADAEYERCLVFPNNAGSSAKEYSGRRTGQFAISGESNSRSNWWTAEPNVGRVAYGIPARVDRLKCLGNAVVPQIAEWLGQRIVEFDLAQ